MTMKLAIASNLPALYDFCFLPRSTPGNNAVEPTTARPKSVAKGAALSIFQRPESRGPQGLGAGGNPT